MKIVILDRKTLGYDIDVSVFEKFGSVISFDVTKPDETKERIKDVEILQKKPKHFLVKLFTTLQVGIIKIVNTKVLA